MIKEYAYYVGDKFMAMGTIPEITKTLGYGQTTIYALRSKSRQKERPNTSCKLVEIGYRKFDAEYLKELMYGDGRPIAEIAKGFGMSDTAFHKIFNGDTKNPHPSTVEKIAEYFDLEPIDLYEFIDIEEDVSEDE